MYLRSRTTGLCTSDSLIREQLSKLIYIVRAPEKHECVGTKLLVSFLIDHLKVAASCTKSEDFLLQFSKLRGGGGQFPWGLLCIQWQSKRNLTSTSTSRLVIIILPQMKEETINLKGKERVQITSHFLAVGLIKTDIVFLQTN